MTDGTKKERIVVAMSGGVDSSVCAGLLVEAGYDVIGITMRLYDAGGTTASSGGRCCGPRDIEDARAVAAHLGIPFYVADYEEAFTRSVVDNFVAEYAEGRTPNPCVRCNQYIKFTPLVTRARALGATALATGHYARLERDEDGRTVLTRGRDPEKDQSYFLFNMPKDTIDFVRFPLGDLTKEEVRAHARRLALPNSDKHESQEICFVPDGDYASFVAARAEMTAGRIVDEAGETLGAHDGVHRFTIGQRRGLNLPLSSPEPRYVVAVDPKRHLVVVGGAEALERSEIVVEDVSWFARPAASIAAATQIRYRHRAESAKLELLDDGRVRVAFDRPVRAVAPGQAAVFFDGARVLGGGFIA